MKIFLIFLHFLCIGPGRAVCSTAREAGLVSGQGRDQPNKAIMLQNYCFGDLSG